MSALSAKPGGAASRLSIDPQGIGKRSPECTAKKAGRGRHERGIPISRINVTTYAPSLFRTHKRTLRFGQGPRQGDL
jgi:hypothetical protein